MPSTKPCPVASGLTEERLNGLADGILEPVPGEARELACRLRSLQRQYLALRTRHEFSYLHTVQTTNERHHVLTRA